MKQHAIPNLKPTTIKTYRSMLDTRILPDLGDLPLKSLTPLLLTKWLTDLRSKEKVAPSLPDNVLKFPRRKADAVRIAANKEMDNTLSDRTVQHFYMTLQAILSKAVQWEILKVNPLDKVDRPKARKKRAKFLTEERAVQLLRCLSKEPNMGYRAAVMLALLCGLRLSEVGALRLSDVDFENNTIDISRALNYTPATGNYEDTTKSVAGERGITLPPGMMSILESTRMYQDEVKSIVGDVWGGDGWIVHGWNGARL